MVAYCCICCDKFFVYIAYVGMLNSMPADDVKKDGSAANKWLSIFL